MNKHELCSKYVLKKMWHRKYVFRTPSEGGQSLKLYLNLGRKGPVGEDDGGVCAQVQDGVQATAAYTYGQA